MSAVSKPKPKLRPPAPLNAPGRVVDVPPTVGQKDTTAGDQLNPQQARVQFLENEFVRVIRQHGKFVVWRKAMLCPCMSHETEQARLACPDCGGGGYIYVDPLQIRAFMAAFDKKTSIYEKYGLWQEGATQISVEPQHRIGYRDSLELLDVVLPMNELLTKGDRRGRRHKLPDGVDSARFRILNVATAFFRDKRDKLQKLDVGEDFKVSDEGWIRWLPPGKRVQEGAILSVHYDFHPIYLVQSWPHVTRDDVSGAKTNKTGQRSVALPVQGMGKLMFLVDANSVPSLDEVVPEPSGFSKVPDA